MDKLTEEQQRIIRDELHRIRPIYNLKILALYGLAFLNGWAILEVPHWSLRVPLYLTMACLFAGLGVILHDGAHGLLFNSKFWNRTVSQIVAATLGIGFTQFRYSHIFHHRDAMNASDRDRLFYLKSIPHTILFGGQALYRSTVAGLRTASRRHVMTYVLEMICVLSVWGALLAFIVSKGWLLQFIHVYAIPFLLFPPILIARLLLEHYECDPDDEYKLSRTFRSNALTRFVWSNVNYHTIHHFWQKIPWYNLKKTHDLIEPHLIANGALISPGYVSALIDALRKYRFTRPPYWAFPPRDSIVWKKRRPPLRERPIRTATSASPL